MQQEIYLLTKRQVDGRILSSNDIPLYYSFRQAEYFFNHAETRIPCISGEEIVLLKSHIEFPLPNKVLKSQTLLEGANGLFGWRTVAQRLANV